MHPHEDVNCYASPAQRAILIRLADHPQISKHFFLTGGTALSVFYLHHRTSDDLDLFAVDPVELSEISFWIRTVWQANHAIIRATLEFLSVLIEDVKVDFAIDALSEGGERARVPLFPIKKVSEQVEQDEKSVSIDTLKNIGANKLCTIVSRTEPKDFVDLYFLLKDIPDLSFEYLFEVARKREALLDDPPTAAYQLEESIRFVRKHTQLLPRLRRPFDLEQMLAFYEDMAKKMYEKRGR